MPKPYYTEVHADFTYNNAHYDFNANGFSPSFFNDNNELHISFIAPTMPTSTNKSIVELQLSFDNVNDLISFNDTNSNIEFIVLNTNAYESIDL